MSFEKKIDRLEEIVKKMEDGEITLDDSLRFFEEGVKLARECQGQLQEAEQKVKLLLEIDAEGKATLTDFKVDLNEKSE
ncbi:MAG: exodeoxyribonuclease VII small subunit [Bdellovibrionales bacterium]|nr:exodeoxyribonuclease VII small subunit [Bdellovibrionales bacterium]